MRGFIHWWAGLDWWIRLSVAGFLLAVSTALWVFADRIWPWGWVAGLVLLLLGGRSDSEKKGYHF
jgi:hypothetical protein